MADFATRFERFAVELRARFPDARVETQAFPSGAQILDFFWRERFWIFAYEVSHAAFGVNEVGEYDFFTLGYDHVFSDFESAQQKLLSLLSAKGGKGAMVVTLG